MNGSKYQVITFHQKVRYYLGSFFNEIVAAIMLDFWQIQMHGLAGKTNFRYNKAMVIAILLQPNIMKSLKEEI